MAVLGRSPLQAVLGSWLDFRVWREPGSEWGGGKFTISGIVSFIAAHLPAERVRGMKMAEVWETGFILFSLLWGRIFHV